MKKLLIQLIICLALLLNVGVAGAETPEAFTPISVAGADYLTNLDICIAAINGTELTTDAIFSFNALVGPRSVENGYVLAANGRGVPVVGGGVAQVATTVYLAVKNMSTMEITEMRTYGSDFCAGYVADVADAVVVDYNQPIDFCFINRAQPVKLQVWRDDNNVYCYVATTDAETAPTQSASATAHNTAEASSAATHHTAEPSATVSAPEESATDEPQTPSETEMETPAMQSESMLPDLSDEAIG